MNVVTAIEMAIAAVFLAVFEMGLVHFLEVSSINFRKKLLFLDLRKIWLICDLFPEVGVLQKSTYCAFKEYFKNRQTNL